MITITQKFKPYTVTPGVLIPIPGSHLYAQVFPSLWRVFTSAHELIHEEKIEVKGPLTRFSVFQDLHRGGLAVTSEQYKYYLLPSGKKVESVKGQLPIIQAHDPLLSLGVHKHLDLHKMRNRRDVKEILPLWYRLSCLLPSIEENLGEDGVSVLLQDLEEQIQERNKTKIYNLLTSIYLYGFSEGLLPRLYDSEYQGILPNVHRGQLEKVPFSLLTSVSTLMQRLFIQREGNHIAILPVLPPEFPCGRFIHIPLEGIGRLSLEWSKKTIRRMYLHAEAIVDVRFSFSSVLSSCRLRQWERKQLVSTEQVVLGESMEIKAGTTYLWDCFYK